ncbi:M20/M25/M40 family metallo-hydrolase [Dyadobacter sediminis]|uniref:M20/M25/M40 family metallo-hydrolase n=1 Tax=Dyadobacter sediminis TaxID=1493691 RepID=A0A5R9KIG6_9BACT|nr:M20/M25/M40 family metallo-hydrolase [Dyadobacter sediminis]TLU96010.1 M20/M25/M40 family metallo-hydrolase [Dyadobacter sediminis]GGB78513.1 aminopeptidase [Dyadobacter sediminis]
MKYTYLFLSLLTVSISSEAQDFNPAAIRKHIEFLASDDLEGRGTATMGEIRAANYIADIFKNAGLKPGGTDQSYFQPFQVSFAIDGNPHLLTARNVVGYLDNGAKKTMVIGAHYDHLGKGFQGSSLTPDSKNKIHNGADDNASGTTGLLELAAHFSGNKFIEKHNILFIAFSGEELGLLGSKYFTENPTIPLDQISCMINMDMIGRLSDEKGLIISGWGTSRAWGKLIPDLAKKQHLRFTVDSSGVGASDHTSFYLKNIPVVQFFTGGHSDYHKISDDVAKINFQGEASILNLIAGLVEKLDNEPAEAEFLTAENPHSGSTSTDFKVTLGIMPDYSYSGKGLRIDAVTKARPADKAGMLTGDIIIRLAGKEIGNIYDYMDVLGSHEAGDRVEAELRRGTETRKVQVTF